MSNVLQFLKIVVNVQTTTKTNSKENMGKIVANSFQCFKKKLKTMLVEQKELSMFD